MRLRKASGARAPIPASRARIVVTAIRNFRAAHAEAAAKHLAKRPRPLVTGFGMAAEENLDQFGDYSKALDIACTKPV